MDYLDLYNFWKTDEFFDIATRNELAAIVFIETLSSGQAVYVVLWVPEPTA